MKLPKKAHIPDQSEEDPCARPTIVTGFAELEDGCLLELIENPKDPGRNLLVFWREGRVEYSDQIEHLDQTYAPLQPEEEVSRRIQLPQGVKPYKSTQKLLDALEVLFARCFTVDPEYMCVLTSFALYTWLADRLPVAVYLWILGRPSSGKTTILETLSLVCRSSLFVDNFSLPSFCRVCERYQATLFIDDLDTYHGPRAHTLRRWLREGTSRSQPMFGAKVMSSQEPQEDLALDSRCIVVPTREVNDCKLIKPTDPSLESEVREIRMRLLDLRLTMIKEAKLLIVPGAEELRARDRDLLGCLAAPLHRNEPRCQELLSFFESTYNQRMFTGLSPEIAVLGGLYAYVHTKSYLGVITINLLTRLASSILADSADRRRLTPRKVGAILTSYGLGYRLRRNTGYEVAMEEDDNQRLHDLARMYGIGEGMIVGGGSCHYCQRGKAGSPVRTGKSRERPKKRTGSKNRQRKK